MPQDIEDQIILDTITLTVSSIVYLNLDIYQTFAVFWVFMVYIMSVTHRRGVSVIHTMTLGWKNLGSAYYLRQLCYCSYGIIYCLN